MDYEAEQAMELEALEAILMDDFQELEGPRPEGWPPDVTVYRAVINPAEEASSSETYEKKMDLVFAYTPQYPELPPLVKPRSIQGLSAAELAEVGNILEEQVQANLGMAMIYALISAAQDWIQDEAASAAPVVSFAEAPMDAAKRAQEEEEKRLAAARALGTPVTPSTFTEWRARFEAEMALARARLEGEQKDVNKGPSGKQWFLAQEAGKQGDDGFDEDDFDEEVEEDDLEDEDDEDEDEILEQLLAAKS